MFSIPIRGRLVTGLVSAPGPGALFSPPLVDIVNDHLVNCPSILSSSARKHSSNSANDIGITHTEKFIMASPPAMGHTRRARADWKTYERFDRRAVMGSA